MTKQEKIYTRRLFVRFMKADTFLYSRKDWNSVMQVAEQIKMITGSDVYIRDGIFISWIYNKKTKKFRDPYNMKIKFYHITVWPHNTERGNTNISKPFFAENRLEAAWLAMQKFIEWYNNTVK